MKALFFKNISLPDIRLKVIAPLTMLVLLVQPVDAQESKYRYQKTIGLVNLVNDAVSQVSMHGDAVFKTFMTSGTRWRTGETYLFVCDLKGQIFVHENDSLVGTNQYDLKDVHGKPIIQWFIRKALGIGQCGWTHYEWVKPEKNVTAWKTSYVRLARAPSGTIYVVGSGLYDMKMEREFAVEAVNDAINQIRVIGKSAFIMLRDSTSEFVYKDTYVFVLDTLGNVIVNLGTPGIEGQNLMDTRDPSGKYFVREMVRTVLDKCEGWVEYQWPKPGSTIPVRKYSFVKRIIYRGETFVVGTGIYLD